VSEATETADPSSLLSTYRNLVALRTAYPSLATSPVTILDSSDPHVIASIRAGGADRLLVIQNLGTDSAANVSFTARQGPMCSRLTGTAEYPPSLAGTRVSAPQVSSTGGFAGYVPVASLPGRSTEVIAFSP
jgi:glycosidase